MNKEKKQQKQQSPFDLAVAHVLERYAWYADRKVEMMPYSEIYKLVNIIIEELTVAHMHTIAATCADYTTIILNDIEHANGLIDALEEASNTIDLLTEHLKAANNTIEFEKRTRLELPRDANGNRIYKDSMLERWGAIEDFWYSNGHWQVRGHDTSAPWIHADKAVVCTEDSDHEHAEQAPCEHGECGKYSDPATPDPGNTNASPADTPAARPQHSCRSRSEAESAIKAFCLGLISELDLLNLLYPSDGSTSERA